jgi:AraC-like DNA-binding protein
VDASSSAVAEALRLGIEALPQAGKATAEVKSPATAEEKLRSALHMAHEQPLRRINRPSGAVLVDVIKSLVGANPQMRISEADIARISRVTPNYFSMLFHKFTGKTFLDFLIEKRLELARTLLRDLTLSISEVALQAGFADPGYFAKVFHKQTGKTPGEWRRKL